MWDRIELVMDGAKLKVDKCNRGDGKCDMAAMIHNHLKPEYHYHTTRSFFHTFVRTAHSFACSALLACLARSSALPRAFALKPVRQLDFYVHSLRCSESHQKLFFQGMARSDKGDRRRKTEERP